jgi:hypothetical protein
LSDVDHDLHIEKAPNWKLSGHWEFSSGHSFGNVPEVTPSSHPASADQRTEQSRRYASANSTGSAGASKIDEYNLFHKEQRRLTRVLLISRDTAEALFLSGLRQSLNEIETSDLKKAAMEPDRYRVRRDGYGYDFTLVDRDGRTVARAKLSRWRPCAALEVEGLVYLAYYAGRHWKQAVLERADGAKMITAHCSGFWNWSASLDFRGRRYELRKNGWPALYHLFRDNRVAIGGFDRQIMEWLVDLPAELPLEINVFVLWLVVMRWRKHDPSALGLPGLS